MSTVQEYASSNPSVVVVDNVLSPGALERIRQASFAFTGVICQEEFDISDKLIVDCCNKEICRECLQRYIAGEFESRRFPVRCLFSPECGDQFSESTLNLIATDEQLELLHEWSRRPTLAEVGKEED